MPFPAIQHLLIAEATRQEAFGKVSVLGFYGVAPDVEIAVKELAKPVQLAFMFVGGEIGAGGHYALGFRVVDENGVVVVQTPEAPTDVANAPDGKRATLVMQFLTAFPHPGRYTIQFLVDGAVHYQNHFRVGQGQAADFVG